MGFETLGLSLLGGGLSAAGSIFGSSQAAKAQERATQAAIAQQRESQAQATNVLSPFVNSGQSILPMLQNYLDPNQQGNTANILQRLLTPGADQSAVLEQLPGYQFNLNQGLRASQNALAARGLGGSGGAAAKGAATFASGLAGNTWQSLISGLQNNFNSTSGAMQNYANMGANSANSLASGILGSGNAIANNMTGLGNAQAGAWNNIGNSLAGFGNNVSQNALLSQLMQRNGGAVGGGSQYGELPNWGTSSFSGPLMPGYG